MILTVDVGNSDVVISTFTENLPIKEAEPNFVARIATSSCKTTDEFAFLVKSIFDVRGISTSDISGAIISSVVPSTTNIINDAIKLFTGKTALVVGPGIKTGIDIKIDNPAQLGSDLLVDSVAASTLYKLPTIVVDMGTATTIFAVNSKSQMVGGAIIPGVMTSLNALTEHTAQLPSISVEAPKKAISTNSVDCMRSGIVNGNAALIEGMVARFEKELGEKATVITTGGLSSEISKYVGINVVNDPTLLLKGLYILYCKNTRTANNK